MKKSTKDAIILVSLAGTAILVYQMMKANSGQTSSANYNPQVGFDAAMMAAGTSFASLATTL